MENKEISEKQLNNISYLLELLKSSINETIPPEPSDDVDFKYIFEFSKKHKVDNTVFYAVERLKNKPEATLYKEWQDRRNLHYFKFVTQKTEYDNIVDSLKKAEIEFLPMKGFLLCDLYPQPDYRDMNDIDILIKGDLKGAGEVLKNLGYSVRSENSLHHDEYVKEPFMLVELHRDIIGYSSRFYQFYSNVFELCDKIDAFEYKMSDEDFYIFNLVHHNKHYNLSGCGIKQIIDMFVLHKKVFPNLNKKYINVKLKQMELVEFHNMISNIAYKWFEKGNFKHFSEDELYILFSYAFGTTENRLSNDHKGKNNFQYVMTKLFPPTKKMKHYYPVLRKKPYLFPLYYIRRIVMIPFFKRGKIKNELKYYKK